MPNILLNPNMFYRFSKPSMWAFRICRILTVQSILGQFLQFLKMKMRQTLIGKNLLGYLPSITFSSPATIQSFFFLVYQFFLPRKRLMDLSLSLSPNKNLPHGDILNICSMDILKPASLEI